MMIATRRRVACKTVATALTVKFTVRGHWQYIPSSLLSFILCRGVRGWYVLAIQTNGVNHYFFLLRLHCVSGLSGGGELGAVPVPAGLVSGLVVCLDRFLV